MPYGSLTPQEVCDALGELGLPVAPADVVLERREGRWMARLPGGRLAWFAATESASAALTAERRLLRLLAVRCGFGVPRVLLESPDGDFDVRSMVPGLADPWTLHARVVGDADAAARLGAGIGAVLADLHTNVRAADVADWLPAVPDWPEPRASVAGRLPRVVADAELHARADEVMARYEALRTADEDRVLVHTDLGFHNLGVDPETLAVRGVFDWGTACWADWHLDFRHLVMATEDETLLDAAIAAYESATGRTLSRARILLHNAAVAIGFLAYRDGVAPDVRWCGRTLEEDLAWTRLAIGRVFESPLDAG
ncbi:MAG TPA: aminoglycoside phosphotransferase family protein [Longimicrobium sp.]|nr:aminoglycoside phosphotransferase family protein [Longimicrobium sp.]